MGTNNGGYYEKYCQWYITTQLTWTQLTLTLGNLEKIPFPFTPFFSVINYQLAWTPTNSNHFLSPLGFLGSGVMYHCIQGSQ